MKRTRKPAEQLSTETQELYNALNNEKIQANVVYRVEESEEPAVSDR